MAMLSSAQTARLLPKPPRPARELAAPILLSVLVVGVIVSVLQAATQINEATLSFVPKILAAVAVLALAGPWMISTLVEYIQRVLQAIPGAVG